MSLRILGVDPGSRITGYGIVDCARGKQTLVACGCIHSEEGSMPERLHRIHEDMETLILRYQPQEAAVEQIFMHTNAQSAIKLGQARGAILVALARHGLPISEYTARFVKKSTVGYGAAIKSQMQFMIQKLLQLQEPPSPDAADALAIALCHAQLIKH